MNHVVDLFPAEWRIELVTRLDEWAPESSPGRRSRVYPLVRHLVRTTGCPMPDSDCWIEGWLGDIGPLDPERLRADPLALRFLRLVLERRTITLGSPMLSALSALAADGLVDRAALVRYVFARMDGQYMASEISRLKAISLTTDEHARTAPERLALAEPMLTGLLRDGTPKSIAPVLQYLRALALTPAENARFLRDHVAMLDLSSLVAAYGQEVLRGLDEAGLLEEDVLSEVCERVLLRPEKKLVRVQLSWLDRAARREPARAGRLLADAALAFRHQDLSLQERVLLLVARHLEKAEEPVRTELRTAARSLGPGLAARAAEVFGTERDPGAGRVAEAEVLPSVSGPRVAPGPVGTPAEVAQELAVVFADDDVVAFERALDGLVRHARLDRTALCQALEPVTRRQPDFPFHYGWDCTQTDLYDVAAAVRGDEARDLHYLHRAIRFEGWFTPSGKMLMARLTEALEVIESGVQPFLLALPTHVTGAVDPSVLVERIAELERLRVEPAPVDLAQALLRATPEAGEQVRRAADDLRSDAGRRLARWLREGGLPRRNSTPEKWAAADPIGAPPGEWSPELPRLDQIPALPPVAAALVAKGEGADFRDKDRSAPYWVAQLPHHRDEVAAMHTADGRLLTRLVEAGGPAGYAMHWQIARGMDRERDAAADALLVLAAQGQLDSRLLAGQLQATIRDRLSSPKRIADALRAAAETGAYETAWSVLEAALPALLRDTPIPGTGSLLALAVECASRCGAKGGIPEVEAVAARTGSSQTVKHARLLRDLLR